MSSALLLHLLLLLVLSPCVRTDSNIHQWAESNPPQFPVWFWTDHRFIMIQKESDFHSTFCLSDVFSTGATAIRAGADDEGDEDSGALQDSSVRVQLLACHFFTLTLLQQRHGSRSAPTWKLHFFPWRLRVFKWGRKNENVSGNKPKFTNMYLNVTKKQVMLKHLAGKDFY